MYVFLELYIFLNLVVLSWLSCCKFHRTLLYFLEELLHLPVEPAGRKLHYSGAPEVAKAAEDNSGWTMAVGFWYAFLEGLSVNSTCQETVDSNSKLYQFKKF